MTTRVPDGVEATRGVLALYENYGPNYRWWVAACAIVGSFATLLTSTIVNVAIPDIMGALGLTLDQALAFAVVVSHHGFVAQEVDFRCRQGG